MNENSMVSFVGDQNGSNGVMYGSNTSSGFYIDNCYIPDSYDWYHQYYPVYIPTYTSYPVYINENKVTKAFKIVQKLMDEKIIESRLNVKKFIEVVNKIAELL